MTKLLRGHQDSSDSPRRLRSALHDRVSTVRQVKLTRRATAVPSGEGAVAARPRVAARRAVAIRAGSDRSCPAVAARAPVRVVGSSCRSPWTKECPPVGGHSLIGQDQALFVHLLRVGLLGRLLVGLLVRLLPILALLLLALLALTLLLVTVRRGLLRVAVLGIVHR